MKLVLACASVNYVSALIISSGQCLTVISVILIFSRLLFLVYKISYYTILLLLLYNTFILGRLAVPNLRSISYPLPVIDQSPPTTT